MTFPGKKAPWWYLVLLVLAVACALTLYALTLEPGLLSAISAGLMAILLFFALSIQLRNQLILGKGGLELRFGPLTRYIAYLDIQSISRTRNPVSSTATSLDRVAIQLQNGRLYLVSVRDNESLIKEVCQRRKRALQGD